MSIIANNVRLYTINYIKGNPNYYLNGERHRDNDEPAIDSKNGYKSWWKNGKRHRDKGLPAIVARNGYKEWWIEGVQYTEDQAKFIYKMKVKTLKRSFRDWYDLAYNADSESTKKRMLRDMEILENELGYKLE